ncbi:pantetheine-phosphate adenylyltransferase [Culicoidibacter larvae]|uniref:Phosphopantetheine adenylyltransferase n=1 Tax=Culicoidibacter larvae TaxID=2579976 RepID=A0A5R8QBR2_9FIRM|nr:pantetheine-phosphate adenylyltransferase [Culicoidibacter larvae]TLG72542.1 pantetheine-phosphate adenylyltransferase [Culicoidibacter larvae]
MRIAIYPGSFDPITNGHLDILERTAAIFDKVYVVLLENPQKKTFFSLDERMDLIRTSVAGLSNVEVASFEGLVVNCAKHFGAQVLIRGLRAVTDFEYELQMAAINKTLDNEVETFFLMTNAEFSFLSSSLVKEVAYFGGEVKKLVPAHVKAALTAKMSERRATE